MRWQATIAVTMLPAVAAGQQPELRLDAIGPAPYAVHAGAGLTAALGYYARVTALGAYGVRPTSPARREWRADLIARVTLDPFRQQRVGLSFGGGLTVRDHAYLLAVAELEGPARAGWLAALQLGAGGGLRAGLVLRRAVTGRR